MEKTLLERCRQYVECVVKYDPTETEERLLADLDAAIAQQAEPVAHVPVHPRNGPLWAMTTATPDPERLPGHYPLMPLYAAPQPPSAKPLMSDMDAVVALCKKGPADAYPAIQPVDERAAFEKEWLNQFEDGPTNQFEDDGRGGYVNSDEEIGWTMWQARAALQTRGKNDSGAA